MFSRTRLRAATDCRQKAAPMETRAARRCVPASPEYSRSRGHLRRHSGCRLIDCCCIVWGLARSTAASCRDCKAPGGTRDRKRQWRTKTGERSVSSTGHRWRGHTEADSDYHGRCEALWVFLTTCSSAREPWPDHPHLKRTKQSESHNSSYNRATEDTLLVVSPFQWKDLSVLYYCYIWDDEGRLATRQFCSRLFNACVLLLVESILRSVNTR